ncbi:hypothetical protein [Bradyrhizobium sp.]
MPSTFLAYSITSSVHQDVIPKICIGVTRHNPTILQPAKPLNASYWIVILNAKNPKERIKEWVFQTSAVVPDGIEAYMNNPDYIFAVATQYLASVQVPQGAFYNFLAKYGAGPELQKLEQLQATLGYGTYNVMSYILTGPCGPRTPVAPPSYEVGSYTTYPALLMMSLESMPNGGPPYGISNNYTWT